MKTNIDNLIKSSKNVQIMIVDDCKETVSYITNLLEDFFDNITVAYNGQEALDIYNTRHIDLILTDINMPIMDGISLIENIREEDDKMPIIILSSYKESHYFLKSIELGINGYIVKPINVDMLLKVLSNCIETISLRIKVDKQREQLEEINNDLEQQMIKRISEIYALNQEIKDTQKEVIMTMGAIGESRSRETGFHVQRVALYSELFAQKYGLSKEQTDLLKEASPMHDIGKIGIADSILNKPAKLTYDEMEIMKTHVTLGYEMLKNSDRDLLKMAAVVAYEHHERYDGSGYPKGLKAEEITISGRITSIADVFDALSSKRAYKESWSDERILKFLDDESGKQFDPKLVDIFFDNKEEFFTIRNTYKDN